MKIRLMVIGKPKFKYLSTGEKEYEKRLANYCKLEEIIIPNPKGISSLNKKKLKVLEGDIILSKLKKNDHLVLLDENGTLLSSIDFADFMKNKMLTHSKSLVFLIGGAYGFSNNIYKRSNKNISLSKMTFSHQMVRLFFKEQLYRAFTIINNTKYHHF